MHKLLNILFSLLMVGAFAACGSVSANDDAGPPTDDAGPTFDAGPTIDADPFAPDAAPQLPSPDNAELTSGSARVTGGVYTMDVMLGHPMSQAPSTGGGNTIEGAAAIKP